MLAHRRCIYYRALRAITDRTPLPEFRVKTEIKPVTTLVSMNYFRNNNSSFRCAAPKNGARRDYNLHVGLA